MVTRSAETYLPSLLAAIRDDRAIYAIVAAYVAIGSALCLAAGGSPLGMLAAYSRVWLVNFGVIAPILAVFAGGVHITHRLNKRRALAYRHMLAPARVGRFLAGILLMLTAGIAFMSTFSALKSVMPADGFPYDVLQADIDKMLHFGVDPWRWLYALGHAPWLQRILEINYNSGWFILCYGLMFWWATSPRATQRARYFITFFATWIVVGNVLAWACLSAGPAFYGQVTGDTARFGEQMAHLLSTNGEFSSVSVYQSYLWRLYATGRTGLGSGISAFPSMHVAMITLNALFIGEFSRRWALAMWAYAALVMISSVYLAWHYAIDGYASLAVTTALYFAIRKLFTIRWKWRSTTVQVGVTAN
jgi:hypothetical protein